MAYIYIMQSYPLNGYSKYQIMIAHCQWQQIRCRGLIGPNYCGLGTTVFPGGRTGRTRDGPDITRHPDRSESVSPKPQSKISS